MRFVIGKGYKQNNTILSCKNSIYKEINDTVNYMKGR